MTATYVWGGASAGWPSVVSIPNHPCSFPVELVKG
jgi:hypothetical protein